MQALGASVKAASELSCWCFHARCSESPEVRRHEHSGAHCEGLKYLQALSGRCRFYRTLKPSATTLHLP